MPDNNKAVICGTVVNDATLSHEFHGEGFCLCDLSVPRLSGTIDTLPTMISDRLVKPEFLKAGACLKIEGQLPIP